MVKKLKNKVRRKFSFRCREKDNGKWEVQVHCREGTDVMEAAWLGNYDDEEAAAHAGEHMVDEFRKGEAVGLNHIGGMV